MNTHLAHFSDIQKIWLKHTCVSQPDPKLIGLRCIVHFHSILYLGFSTQAITCIHVYHGSSYAVANNSSSLIQLPYYTVTT